MADARLAPAVAALARGLKSFGGPHMLIGGVAVIARGVRRLTDDVDATVWAAGVDVTKLVAALAQEGVKPRIAEAVAFARQSQVLLLEHTASGVAIDLSLAWLPFEREGLKQSTLVRIGKARVPVARPEDLVIYKAIAARERDRSDVERLLELHAETIDLARVRRVVAELADAVDAPELAERLDEIIDGVAARRARRAPPAKRPRPRPVKGKRKKV